MNLSTKRETSVSESLFRRHLTELVRFVVLRLDGNVAVFTSKHLNRFDQIYKLVFTNKYKTTRLKLWFEQQCLTNLIVRHIIPRYLNALSDPLVTQFAIGK